MTIVKQTKAAELRKIGVTLAYFATVAGRSAQYVRQWSRGKDASAYLDKVAAELIAQRTPAVEGGQRK